ncbi:UPF0496 protein At3g49070-like [Macadamia integrifolia]|uniref:UPF0496 protein At3g49070-like n=1 Tax=Macadamia integrifolia TaxID=60698 RepID=UPI001C52ACD0|nr:UPF0496 protein At3g49070-like [Macadamia integrifolia]
MTIKFSLHRMGQFLSRRVSGVPPTGPESDIDVREEYANAFRTESYTDFWSRILTLTNGDSATCIPVESSTTATRLPSYRLFAEHLLEPDQPTVTQVLGLAQPQNHPENHSILSDYFAETADASLLCGLLLKDIHKTRAQYHPLKTTIHTLETTQFLSKSHFPVVLDHLTEFAHSLNPFGSSANSLSQFRAVQAGCTGLLKRLESSRDQARARLRLVKRFKHGSAVFLVALTASVVVIVTAHGLAMLVAVPGFIMASIKLASTKSLARLSAQLDAAAKGTYILNRDLDTIRRLLTRLHDELEHLRTMVQFWLERKEDRFQPIGEVARQLKKNNSSFTQQLDELEEHLYLCFMTINRARSLVMKKVMEELSRV